MITFFSMLFQQDNDKQRTLEICLIQIKEFKNTKSGAKKNKRKIKLTNNLHS